MRSGLAIRPVAAADAEVVVRIYIDSWNASFGELLSQADRTVTPELVARWRRDLARPVPHRWWVAERSGAIVGCAGIGPSRDPVDPSIGELDSIFVDEPHWRTGSRQRADCRCAPPSRPRRLPCGDTLDRCRLSPRHRLLRGDGVAP